MEISSTTDVILQQGPDKSQAGAPAGAFVLKQASTLANGARRAERQPLGATEVEGAYTEQGSSLEAGAPTSILLREAYEDAPWGGGDELLKNWRPLFKAKHRRYAELREKFGPPLLDHPLHGEVLTGQVEKKSGPAPSSPSWLEGYLESLAKRSVDLESIFKTKCPGYWIQGSCENGHRYAKELYCGREWCTVCGEEWSAAHQRRFARWISKATQIKSMGYFVFTIPEELRANFRTKKALASLGHQIQEQMKFYGYSRGLRRWHFFGEKSTRYNPHLNVFVDAGFISESKLDTIKQVYAVLLGVDVADVHYHYRHSPGEKVHSLKYVTRATFRDYSWDSRMALELRGFRNQLWWGSGKWDQAPAWSLDDLQGKGKEDMAELDSRAVESLESGTCPSCGLPLDWSKVMPISVLEAQEGKRSLGAGYWELPPVRPPPGRLKFPHLEQIAYLLKICHAAGVEVERY